MLSQCDNKAKKGKFINLLRDCSLRVLSILENIIVFRINLQITMVFVFILLLSFPAWAGTHYVDSGATGAGNGTSWTDAWTSPLSISGVSAGSTVYISGGTSTKTYNMSSYWNPPSGTAGNPITYKIGQASPHNGTAIFNATGGTTIWLTGSSNIVVSGDAGDAANHFKIVGYVNGITNSSANVTVEYINASEVGTLSSYAYMGGSDISGLTLRNSSIKIDDPNSSTAVVVNTSATAYDVNVYDKLTLLLPRNSSRPGFGVDGFSFNNSSTIKNSTIRWYDMNYTGGQHADGWQGLGGSYIKIYGNTIVGAPNYALFAELQNDFRHVRAYNNLVMMDNPSVATAAAGGIIFGVGGGCNQASCDFDDIIIANNTIVDFATGRSISLNDVNGKPHTFTNCYIQNNAIIATSGTIDLTGNSTSTVDHNATITGANAPNSVVRYTQWGGTSNDLQPKAGDTVLIGTGVSLSSYLTADILGTSLPQGAVWNIGSYGYNISLPKVVLPNTITNVQIK